VLTSNSQHAQPSWLNFVFTAKARSKIQAILRRDNRELQKVGEDTLNQWVKGKNLELTPMLIDQLCKFHDISNQDDLFVALGKKTVMLSDKDAEMLNEKKKSENSSGWRKYVPFLHKSSKKKEEKNTEDIPKLIAAGEGFDKKKPCIISERTIGMYVFPKCCHPIPGDDILGFIDGKKHVEIHKRSCPVASKLKTSFGPRILDAKWDMHKQLFFDATIELHGIDRKGMLHDVAEIISNKMNVNIHTVSFTADDGIFEGRIEIRVHDRDEVRSIMGRLKKIADMQEVQQIM
jgi:GTP pyrophosphokinase